MSNGRTPRERLDALLAGLEDEVLRSDQTGRYLADEGVAAKNAGATRYGIESLIHVRSGGPGRRKESLRGDGDGAKAKVVRARERLGRWAGVAQGGRLTGAAPRVRMAFSGERLEKAGKTAHNATRRRRDGADGTGNED